MTNIPMVEVTSVPDPEREARILQGLSEGVVVDVDTVTCLGETYRIADRVGLMPLMRFAHSARKGVQSDDMAGLVAMYDMLRDCILDTDWDRFENDMTRLKATDTELMGVVTRTMEILSARPTQPRSDSSSGRTSTTPNSTDASSPQASPGPRQHPGAEDLVDIADLGRVLASA